MSFESNNPPNHPCTLYEIISIFYFFKKKNYKKKKKINIVLLRIEFVHSLAHLIQILNYDIVNYIMNNLIQLMDNIAMKHAKY